MSNVPETGTWHERTHYQAHPSGIQPIEITMHETFLRGNIIKYVMRAPYKGRELEDLKKAKDYLELEIARLEDQTSAVPLLQEKES